MWTHLKIDQPDTAKCVVLILRMTMQLERGSGSAVNVMLSGRTAVRKLCGAAVWSAAAASEESMPLHCVCCQITDGEHARSLCVLTCVKG